MKHKPQTKLGRVREYLTKHPEAKTPEISRALGIDLSSSVVSVARRQVRGSRKLTRGSRAATEEASGPAAELKRLKSVLARTLGILLMEVLS